MNKSDKYSSKSSLIDLNKNIPSNYQNYNMNINNLIVKNKDINLNKKKNKFYNKCNEKSILLNSDDNKQIFNVKKAKNQYLLEQKLNTKNSFDLAYNSNNYFNSLKKYNNSISKDIKIELKDVCSRIEGTILYSRKQTNKFFNYYLKCLKKNNSCLDYKNYMNTHKHKNNLMKSTIENSYTLDTITDETNNNTIYDNSKIRKFMHLKNNFYFKNDIDFTFNEFKSLIYYKKQNKNKNFSLNNCSNKKAFNVNTLSSNSIFNNFNTNDNNSNYAVKKQISFNTKFCYNQNYNNCAKNLNNIQFSLNIKNKNNSNRKLINSLTNSNLSDSSSNNYPISILNNKKKDKFSKY